MPLSHIWMRLASRMNESGITYEYIILHTWQRPHILSLRQVWQITPHIWMSHASRMRESCRTYKCVTSHAHITHLTVPMHCLSPSVWHNHATHVNETCITYERVMPHVWMRHVTSMIAPMHCKTSPSLTMRDLTNGWLDKRVTCHQPADIGWIVNAASLMAANYGVATISRLFQIVGLFRKTAILKRPYSRKETSDFKEPTNGSHSILDNGWLVNGSLCLTCDRQSVPRHKQCVAGLSNV